MRQACSIHCRAKNYENKWFELFQCFCLIARCFSIESAIIAIPRCGSKVASLEYRLWTGRSHCFRPLVSVKQLPQQTEETLKSSNQLLACAYFKLASWHLHWVVRTQKILSLICGTGRVYFFFGNGLISPFVQSDTSRMAPILHIPKLLSWLLEHFQLIMPKTQFCHSLRSHSYLGVLFSSTFSSSAYATLHDTANALFRLVRLPDSWSNGSPACHPYLKCGVELSFKE